MYNLNSMHSDMFTYSADAAMFRSLSRQAATLGIKVTIHHDPVNRQDVITMWEQGEELVSRGFDPYTGGHNACHWMGQQLKAYSSWK